MRVKIRHHCLGACVAATLVAFGPGFSQEFERGKPLDKVVCLNAPEQSYALYLPTAFIPGEKWPVLFLFDPGARGLTAIEAFRAAAEEFGWILIGSNNSRNGPMEISARAASAIWEDARRRLPVDEKRVYAGGFSGGSRVASIFPLVVGRPIAGIIGCGAGLSSGLKPAGLEARAYFGLTGLADFNYGEMKALDLAFDAGDTPHRFLFFDGRHDWPDPAGCARAVEWMEVTAMKQGLRPSDPTLIDAALAKELDEARSLEAEGRLFWAVDRLESAARLASGLDPDKDPAGFEGLAGRIERHKARDEYGRFLEAERKRDRRAAAFRDEFSRAFGSVEDSATGGAPAVPKVLRATGIAHLKKEAKGAGAIEDRALASRMLFDFCFAARTRALDLYGRSDFRRAGAYLDLAIAACEDGLDLEAALNYDRACVAALAGDKALALRHLALAVDKGFNDIGLLEGDKDLESLRSGERFSAIVEKARASVRR
jgi:predicted esterase